MHQNLSCTRIFSPDRCKKILNAHDLHGRTLIMKQNTRIQLENILIGALCALSLVLFVLSFLPGLGLANRVSVFLEMGHMVQRAFSVVLFILTFQLKKRKRAAWNIAVILLFLSFLRGLTSLSAPLYLPFHIAEAVLYLLLLPVRPAQPGKMPFIFRTVPGRCRCQRWHQLSFFGKTTGGNDDRLTGRQFSAGHCHDFWNGKSPRCFTWNTRI